jgi:hypothetical protein
MLDGLDQIPWDKLSHAYGPASDVPALIRQLADGSKEVRDNALHELFGNIWHQGTIYEATSHAVPFLVELVTDRTIPDRGRVLYLLQSISEGWLLSQAYLAQQGKFLPAAVAKRHARELPHYQAAHAAVANGIAALEGLLSDEDADVRIGSAFVLATLAGRAGGVAASLLDAIDRESDDRCRAALQFALLALAQNAGVPGITDVAIRRFGSALDDSSSGTVALGAGIALLHLGQEAAIPRVLELARMRLVEDHDLFANLPWEGAGSLFSVVDRGLRFAPREQLKWIVEGLNHADPEVRSTAMCHGNDLCKEFRWAPSELVPVYAKLVEGPDAQDRKMALRWMRSMGAAGAACLKTFLQHRLADVRAEAAAQLQRIQCDQTQRQSWLAEKRPFLLPSVASLMRSIDRHRGSRKWQDEQQVLRAVINLGFRGQGAVQAVETVRSLTDHDNPWIRVHAIRSLWKITHDCDVVVPLLRASLKPEPAAFLALECLRQMGGTARSVATELRSILDSERRYFRGGSDNCGLDEAFCDACSATLRVIEGAG